VGRVMLVSIDKMDYYQPGLNVDTTLMYQYDNDGEEVAVGGLSLVGYGNAIVWLELKTKAVRKMRGLKAAINRMLEYAKCSLGVSTAYCTIDSSKKNTDFALRMGFNPSPENAPPSPEYSIYARKL
jgi:hypothetical protein